MCISVSKCYRKVLLVFSFLEKVPEGRCKTLWLTLVYSVKIVTCNGFARGLAASVWTMQWISMQGAKAILHKLLQSDVCNSWRSRWEMTAESVMPLLGWCHGIHGKARLPNFLWMRVTNCFQLSLPLSYMKECSRGDKKSWQKSRNACSLPELGGAHSTSSVVATLFSYTEAQAGRDSVRTKLTDLYPISVCED